MRRVFLGPALYWAVLAAILLGLYLMGGAHLHTRAFNLFSAIALGLVALAYAVVLATYRPGMRVTRDPLDGD